MNSDLLRFLSVAGGLIVTVNLILPAFFYRHRIKSRRAWAAANGFTPCEETQSGLTVSRSQLAAAFSGRGKVLSCLARGPLRVTDFRYRQTLGGFAGRGGNVNRALTLVEISLGRQVPDIVAWPRFRGAGGLLLGGLALAPGVRGSPIGSLFSSITTGDGRFDERFQIMAPDEAATRELLTKSLRREMVEAGRLTFLFAGREALIHGRGLSSASQLDQLVAAADAIEAALALSP
jgi:hypothetical protein